MERREFLPFVEGHPNAMRFEKGRRPPRDHRVAVPELRRGADQAIPQ
jgi:hypothetical protein